MTRWQPGTPDRLRSAALELFATRGFEQTTAADIARAVGLTERTFFRHFADKREVIFAGQDQLVATIVDAVSTAATGEPPMAAVARGIAAAGGHFTGDRRESARQRQVVVDANPSLQERERHKLARLADSVAGALRARGVPEPAATLAGETGATVFTVAFGQWITDGETRPFGEVAAAVLAELTAVLNPAAPSGSERARDRPRPSRSPSGC